MTSTNAKIMPTGLGIDVVDSQMEIHKQKTQLDASYTDTNRHDKYQLPTPTFSTFNGTPNLSDSPASLVSVDTPATPDDHLDSPTSDYNFGTSYYQGDFSELSNNPNFSHPLSKPKLVEIPHPINRSMNYSLRRRSLGEMETAIYNEAMGYDQLEPNQQPPLVALLPMYLSPNLDSLSQFPYKNSITPTIIHSQPQLPSGPTVHNTTSDRETQSNNPFRPQSATRTQPLDHLLPSSTTSNNCGTSPQQDLFITRHDQKRVASGNGLRSLSMTPKDYNENLLKFGNNKDKTLLDDPQDSTPLWGDSDISLRQCSPQVARAIIAAAFLFPPIWLLIAGGCFDTTVGTIRPQEKLLALALAATFTVVVIACIIVGFVLGL